MLDYDIEVSEAEQKWFIAIMLGGAFYYTIVAIGLGIQMLPFLNNILGRIFN